MFLQAQRTATGVFLGPGTALLVSWMTNAILNAP